MDQALLGFAVFAALCSGALAVGALIAWLVLRGSLRRLERQVASLELQLSAREGRASRGVEPVALATRPTPVQAQEPLLSVPAPSEPPSAVASEPERETTPPAIDAAAEELPRAPIPPTPPAARIDWERRMGVRGAALLGGAILALAGILFVQYSIQRGWLGPAQRCALGFAAGIACIAGSWPLLRRRYTVTSEALTGAGLTLLFAATWSARVRHELIPFWLAVLAMAGATAMCCWLAARRESRTIAVFGLIGGFVTPLLLSLGATQPLGLFGYLIALDLGLLALARSRRWPVLATLGSIATPFVFALWILRHFSPSELPYALIFCGVSSLLFSLGSGDGRARAAPILGSLTPFFFSIYFAGSTATTPHLLPIAVLLAVLVAGASVAALRLKLAGLLVIAALGSSVSLVTWAAAAQLTNALCWELALCAVGLASVAHLAVEWAARRSPDARARIADGVSAFALGHAAVIAVGVFEARSVALWPWLFAVAALSALLLRQLALGGRNSLAFAAAFGATATYALWNRLHTFEADLAPTLDALVVVLVGAGALLPLALGSKSRERDASWAGALAAMATLMLTRISFVRPIESETITTLMATASALTLFGLLAARSVRPAIGWALFAGLAWIFAVSLLQPQSTPAPLLRQLGCSVLTAAAFAVLPLLDRRRLGASPGVWRTAATVTALWSLPLFALWTRLHPSAPEWGLFVAPMLLAATVAVPLASERRASDDEGVRTSRATGFAWFAPLALLSAALAFVNFVERAELAVGAALAALAFAFVARVASHPWLRLATLPLAALSFVGGAANLIGAAEGWDFTRSGWPVLHWLSYAFAVPAAALLASAWLLRENESERLARTSAFPRAPVLAGAPGWLVLGGILWSFGWLNVEVVNLCSDGLRYALELTRLPVRDVALSVAWTVFSLTLLILGVRLDRTSLRWTSLVFFLATIAKVFLYDLGEVHGLFRVASLVGLALALLSVSLLYQRFVFRPRAPATE
jgi:hypothetical protein